MIPIVLSKILADLAGWFLLTFGRDIQVLVKNQIQKRFQRVFDNRAILILGATASGKTALIWYLTKGKPYEEQAGRREQPNPTLGTVVLDEQVSISADAEVRYGRIKGDVGGEFRDEWQRLMWEIDPHGIIYMMDGRKSPDELKEATQDLYTYILSQYNQSGLRQLRALHIFLNFSDVWAKSKLEEAKKRSAVELFFNETRDNPEWARLVDLNFMVSVTQLSSEQKAWTEVDKALEHFAADLTGKK